MTSNAKRHRSFGSHNKKATKEPVSFDVLGVDEEGNEFTETFTARATVPGMSIIDFAAGGAGEGKNSVAAVQSFYKKALPEEEYARFIEFTDNPKFDVELDTLVEIIGFLVEEYASRPTKAPSQ